MTFQLSVSDAQLQLRSSPGEVYSEESLDPSEPEALPTLTTKRGGEGLLVFVHFVYSVKREQERVRLRWNLKSAAAAFERLTVCFRMHAHTPCAHFVLYPLAVFAGEDENGQRDVQNKMCFFFLFSSKTLFPGGTDT